MSSVADLLSYDNVVLRCYAFWASVLVLKMLCMSLLTAMQRFRTMTFPNEEDLPSKKLKVKFDDPNVERVRRAHRNDLENIIPFLIIAFLYILTDPAPGLAINLIRVAAIGRVLHTLVYAIVAIPQPSRALAFVACLVVTIYMAFKTLVYFFYI